MADCLSERAQKMMTFIGGFLILFPNGVSWYWGNVSIYVYSYFHHINKTEDEHMRAPWLLSMYVVSWSTAGMLSGYVNTKVGSRPAIVIGILIFNGGLMGSYFVFSESLAFLDVTMGIVCGFGNGLIHSMILQTIVEWTVTHIGLATAFMVTSYAVGSVIINQFITHYLNPDNKPVNVVIGETHYFSQKDILSKVPKIFIGLFLFSGAFHIIGFLLLRTRETTEYRDHDKEKVSEDDASLRGEINTISDEKLSFSQSEQSDLQPDCGYCTDDSFTDPKRNNLSDTKMNDTLDSSIHSINSNKSPRQVLKTWLFYVLWFTMFCSDSAFMCLSNFYKIFGQIWIKDDHFLTNLGTSLALSTVGMRLLWGYLTDIFGMKLTLVTLTTGLSLISTGYFFTAQWDRWLFFTSSIVYACLNCGMYVSFIVAAHSLFGQAHFTTNCGMVMSSTIVLNLVFPSATQLLLSYFGWFAVFFTVGVLNFLGLVLIICSIPE